MSPPRSSVTMAVPTKKATKIPCKTTKNPSVKVSTTTTLSSTSTTPSTTTASSSSSSSLSDANVQRRRLEQRRRAVLFGKNTVGYHVYTTQVPKHTRRARSMIHPSTPDYKNLTIPTKRWQGMIKAWRKALHQYDPPDLQKAFAEVSRVEQELQQELQQPKHHDKNDPRKPPQLSVQEMELQTAYQKGLAIDYSGHVSTKQTEEERNHMTPTHVTTHVATVSPTIMEPTIMMTTTTADDVLDQWQQQSKATMKHHHHDDDDDDEYDHLFFQHNQEPNGNGGGVAASLDLMDQDSDDDLL